MLHGTPPLYCQLISSFMYLVNSRPDLCFVVNTLSQFMVEPRRVHQIVAKHVLRYLASRVDYGLDYRISDGVRLIGFMDSDWLGSVADHKITFGCCFNLYSAAVLWFSQNKKSVDLIFDEDQYMEASQARCKELWLRKSLVDLFDQTLRPTVICCENESCIQLS